MLFALGFSLDSRIVNSTNFFAVKLLPLAPVEFEVEPLHRLQRAEVDECVSDVAVVQEVYGQVEEVEFPAELVIQQLQDLLLRILVRDVPHH